jgi:aminomethyltransferase
MSISTETLKRTPLHAAHVQAGAKMVPFGGWDMPVQYDGILAEHQAVRQKVGVFDISHMGEFTIAGPNAEAVLNRLLTNDVRKTAVGQGQYTLMCTETGGVVDDLIFYRIAPTVFLLVVNAGNIDKDFSWIKSHAHAPIEFENASDRTAALAVQGPDAVKVLPEVANLAPFHIVTATLFGTPCRVARTGYTGEDGFEILCDAANATGLWNELLKRGVKPCGLGARDTLRLEACLPLHGNDITELTTPIEAGLNRFVSLDKGDFIGRNVLAEQREKGVARKLMAFKMAAEKCPPPRSHYPILAGGRKIGEVTSGSQSPTLGGGIGLGYIETPSAVVGTAIEIEVRGKLFPAVIEKKPLYKRGK